MSNSVEKLVNAFNLNNYFCERVNTNFTVKGNKIVGLFADDTDVAEYLHRIGEEIIKQQYSSREVAGRYYNLNYFPFVLGANPSKKKSNIKGVMEVKLADSANREVIHNLKIHLVNEFDRAVTLKLIARLQKAVGITEEEAHKWTGETFRIAATGKSSSYLYCIVFSDEYLRKEGYDSETFELLKGEYIKEFNSRLRECGLKSSDFYEYKDDMLYIKNISDKVVRSVAEYERGRVALDFRTPGTEDSKVENFKDVLGDFIFKWTRKSINAYGYDIFADEGKIGSGNNFVLIPLTKACDDQLEFLKRKDVYKINIEYKNLMSDIRGKTADPDINSCENPIYAFSNKGIAQLLPKIMESAITYNKENKRFEFAVDPGNFRRRDSIRGSQSSSTVTSPTRTNSAGSSQLQSPLNSPMHAEPPRTPPEQTGDRFKEDRDSGIGESPPQFKDSVEYFPSGDPRSLFKQPRVQESPTRSQDVASERSPRQSSEQKQGLLHNSVAEPSEGFSPRSYVSSTTVNLVVPGPSKSGKNLSAAAVDEFGTSDNVITSDRYSPTSYVELLLSDFPSARYFSSSSSSVPEILEDSISSNLGLFAQSPKGKESTFDVEPEELQVTDKSDQKSSDECPEAKQKSESPKKKHEGDFQKIKDFFSSLFKSKQHDASLERYDVGRGTTRSAPVTKKSPLPEQSASERRAKSSGVTSPVSSLDGDPGPSQGTISGKREPHLPVEHRAQLPDNSSSKKAYRDSGIGSLERGQPQSPTKKLSVSRVDKLVNMFKDLLKNPASPTHKDVSGRLKLQQHLDPDQRKELRKKLSSEMKKKLDSKLFLPEYEKLLYLLYVDKREVRLLLSPPGEVEQVCSVEEKEQVQSSSSEEEVHLLQEFFSNQKVSDNYLTSSKDSGISLGSSSQKSTSDTESDEDERKASGWFPVSSSPSSELVPSIIEKAGSPSFSRSK